LKREPSTAARTLRAVSLVITLISILTFVTLAYSGYEDVAPLVQGASGGPPPIAVSPPQSNGQTSTIFVNVTLHNGGLYPIGVSIACSSQTNGTSCSDVAASVVPGQTQVIHFSVTTQNSNLGQGGSFPNIIVSVQLSLVPFLTLSVTINPAALAGGGSS
jgi:hypothetical protein